MQRRKLAEKLERRDQQVQGLKEYQRQIDLMKVQTIQNINRQKEPDYSNPYAIAELLSETSFGRFDLSTLGTSFQTISNNQAVNKSNSKLLTVN